MKMFASPPEIYLYRDPVDFRKSINGLAAIVEDEFGQLLTSGALFLFSNRQRDKIKILYWDNTGFALWYKRLEQAKFTWPHHHQNDTFTLTESELNRLLSGYSIIGHSPVIATDLSLN